MKTNPIVQQILFRLEQFKDMYHDNHEKNEGRAYKLLGIFLDQHLNFNNHVQFLCNKLDKSMFYIKQAKKTYLQPLH
jgi:hypothetical protein